MRGCFGKRERRREDPAAGAVVVAAILLVLSRRKPDPIALEALAIRRRAIEQLSVGSPLGVVVRIVRCNHPAREIGRLLAESLVRAISRR